MKYQSSRGGVRDLSFEDVLFSGYAPDGGLFVPSSVPRLSRETLRSAYYKVVVSHLYRRPVTPFYIALIHDLNYLSNGHSSGLGRDVLIRKSRKSSSRFSSAKKKFRRKSWKISLTRPLGRASSTSRRSRTQSSWRWVLEVFVDQAFGTGWLLDGALLGVSRAR